MEKININSKFSEVGCYVEPKEALVSQKHSSLASIRNKIFTMRIEEESFGAGQVLTPNNLAGPPYQLLAFQILIYLHILIAYTTTYICPA